ncbi:MAG: WG repeat-containing protein [Bacteroidales bacterium]|nr:WG repeat-containing protein [Bacteroidales bacterium]
MKLKKALLGLLALAAGLPMSTSCSGDNDRILPYEYIAVQVDKDGSWSFYGPDGEVLLKDEFKNRPSDVVDGYFFVQEGKKEVYTLYKFDKKKPEAIAEGFKDLGYMGEGLIPSVRENERISVLDNKGKVKFTLQPVNGKEVTGCAARYNEGLLLIGVDDGDDKTKYGYINTEGKAVIAPKFSRGSYFKDGLAIVCLSDDTWGEKVEYAIIDKKGETVKKFRTGTIPVGEEFMDGYLILRDSNDRCLIVDKKGETVTKLPAKAKGVKDWNKKYIVFKDEDGNCGVMDFEGEVIIRPKYSWIQIIDSDRFLATEEMGDDTRSLILDKDGEEELRIDSYKYGVGWYYQFGLVGRDKNTVTFLEDDGKARKHAEFNNFGGVGRSVIRSDYFNAEAAISEIVNLINDKGVDKYIIGGTPADQLSNLNPEDYSYKYTAELDNLAKEGVNWELTASASYQGGYLSDYNYNYNDYSRYYYWNPYTHLARVDLDITCDKWDATESEALAKALVNKGFTKESSTGSGNKRYCALLTKGDLAVIIYSSNVVVCQNTSSNRENANQIISDYDTNPDDEVDFAIPAVSYEYEVPVDSADSVVAVEAYDYAK